METESPKNEARRDESVVKCALCDPNDQESILIMSAMVGLILKKNMELNMESFRKISQEQFGQRYEGGLSRLLKYMFEASYAENSEQAQCQHKEIYEILQAELSSSKDVVDYLCENVIDFLSGKSYQLQVLQSQVKTVAKGLSLTQASERSEETNSQMNIKAQEEPGPVKVPQTLYTLKIEQCPAYEQAQHQAYYSSIFSHQPSYYEPM